jgi:hypothetical protein
MGKKRGREERGREGEGWRGREWRGRESGGRVEGEWKESGEWRMGDGEKMMEVEEKDGEKIDGARWRDIWRQMTNIGKRRRSEERERARKKRV